MNQRRPQAASLVSLLVVTSFFVWACSSSVREVWVTTGGGAGSVNSRAGARASESENAAGLGAGGTLDVDVPATVGDAGEVPESTPADVDSGAGGEPEMNGGGAGSELEPPPETGGTFAMSSAGAAGTITPNPGGAGAGGSSAGSTATGGAAGGSAPVASEPVCDPAEDHSTPEMFLPCDVSTALYVCRNCHSNPPVKGVFSSYVTYADIKANAAQIYGVIKSGTMPWPPYTMSAWQKSTALKWLGKNGSCAIGAANSCQ